MGLCEFRAAPGAAGGRLTGAEHGGQTGAQMALGALWHPVGPSSFFFRLAFRRATSGPTGVSGWRGKPFFLLGGEALALGFGFWHQQPPSHSWRAPRANLQYTSCS